MLSALVDQAFEKTAISEASIDVTTRSQEPTKKYQDYRSPLFSLNRMARREALFLSDQRDLEPMLEKNMSNKIGTQSLSYAAEMRKYNQLKLDRLSQAMELTPEMSQNQDDKSHDTMPESRLRSKKPRLRYRWSFGKLKENLKEFFDD